MAPWVVNLKDPTAADPGLVGGKAAALHRLLQAGLPVPEGFVVTTEAFTAHFPDRAPGQRPVQPHVHPALAEAVDHATGSVFPPDVSLAVRSSALGEDGAQASFAGQHETHYYVPADGVTESVICCWLSLWSPQAQAYRSRRGDPDQELTMAVIVQRLVQADRSGVCFTADPTGRYPQQVCIEAVWGLGAALVDGRVSPDRVFLTRSGRLLQRHIGRKRHRVATVLREPGEPRLEPVALFDQTRPVLDGGQVDRVLEASLAAERLAGCPQDVEWAFEDDAFYLLQSRPITTPTVQGGELAAAAAADSGGWVLFKPLAENFTEPLTPLSIDLLQRVLPPSGRFIDGRYYLSLRLARRLCPFRWSDRELADVLLLRGDVPELRWDWRKAPLAIVAFVVAYLLDGIAWHRSAHLSRAGLAEFENLCTRIARSGLDPPRTLRRLVLGGSPFEPMGRKAYYVNVSAGRYFLLLGVLMKLMERCAADFDPHLVGQLCSGDGGTKSRELVEGVRALAATARSDTDLCKRLSDVDNRQLSRTLAALPATHQFALALQGFLGRFGHRCTREMELAAPRWREDPLPVLLMVRGYLRAEPTPAPDAHAHHLLARDALRRALPRRWQRRIADWLIGRIRYYTSLREDTRYYHAMAMDVTRAKLLDLEQRLLAEGRLRLPGDVFYLEWGELEALEAGRLRWSDVGDMIRRRRRRERTLTRAGAPELVGAPDLPARTGAAMGATVLVGQCASPGTAEGRVRIVLDPTMADDLEPGDVLVAPYTDPAWTPLFPLAAAVVVEVGSFLSHAGTVAREYRIPCLVDVTDCTRRLEEGQRVRVIAGEGRLEVLGR